jgi:hypothetical protein
MKPVDKAAGVVALLFLFFSIGCDSIPVGDKIFGRPGDLEQTRAAYDPYAPVKLEIIPLTEFVGDNEDQAVSAINVYVALLDQFDSQVKSPGTFRFEIYEYLQRSARNIGRRVAIWPDIDLKDAEQNNSYWRDFLRAYYFELDFMPQGGKKYILQATCICPNGIRLSGEYLLELSD